MCDLIVVTRPGYELNGNVLEIARVVDGRGISPQEISELLTSDSGPRVFLTDAAMVDVSATAIRAAARSGEVEKLREMVPASVASYIEKYELYRN
jgi:nicotinic acid mononucleotide adenylyltransferase